MTDFQPVTDRELARSYWYLTHREQLRRAGIIALIVVCVVLWGYSIIRLTYLFVVEEPKTRVAVAGLPDTLVRARDFLPPMQEIQTVAADVFTQSDGQSDFYAHIQNPNTQYAALSFTYSFVYDDGETPRATGYLLPGGAMYLTALGVASERVPKNPRVFIESVSWKRILGWEERRATLFDFPVSESTVVPIANDGQGGVTVHFTLTNNTSYNFWMVDVPVLLLRGDRVVGVNAIRLSALQSQEHRPVALQWPDAPVSASSVQIVPQVNVLDPLVFQGVKSGEQKF